MYAYVYVLVCGDDAPLCAHYFRLRKKENSLKVIFILIKNEVTNFCVRIFPDFLSPNILRVI